MRSLALSRQERSTCGIILALLNSDPLLTEGLDPARSVGDTYAMAAARHELSFVALQQRTLPRARDYARENLALQHTIHDQRGVIRSVERWAALRLAEGRCGASSKAPGAPRRGDRAGPPPRR